MATIHFAAPLYQSQWAFTPDKAIGMLSITDWNIQRKECRQSGGKLSLNSPRRVEIVVSLLDSPLGDILLQHEEI